MAASNNQVKSVSKKRVPLLQPPIVPPIIPNLSVRSLNQNIISKKILPRSNMIIKILKNIPVAVSQVIISYDYYLEGVIDMKINTGNNKIKYLFGLPNGHIFMVHERSNGAKIFDKKTGNILFEIKEENHIGSVELISNGIVIISYGYKIRIWDSNTYITLKDFSTIFLYRLYVLSEIDENIRIIFYTLDEIHIYIYNREMNSIDNKIIYDKDIQKIYVLSNIFITTYDNNIIKIWTYDTFNNFTSKTYVIPNDAVKIHSCCEIEKGIVFGGSIEDEYDINGYIILFDTNKFKMIKEIILDCYTIIEVTSTIKDKVLVFTENRTITILDITTEKENYIRNNIYKYLLLPNKDLVYFTMELYDGYMYKFNIEYSDMVENTQTLLELHGFMATQGIALTLLKDGRLLYALDNNDHTIHIVK